MSEKPKEEFEDEEPDELEEAAEDLDVDQLMRDFDTRKRRGARGLAASTGNGAGWSAGGSTGAGNGRARLGRLAILQPQQPNHWADLTPRPPLRRGEGATWN